MSKEFKPQIYYLARRKWYGQMSIFCDGIVAKKGKDPVAIYWKAFAVGMSGNTNDALRLLESFQSRRDMQYPVTIARLYFHERAQVVDHEAIDSLKSDLSVAEDVAKEAGLVLAARFSLFTNDFYLAKKVAEKLLEDKKGSDNNVSTAFELEAVAIKQWCMLTDFERSNSDKDRKKVQSIDSTFRGKGSLENFDVDSLMIWAQSRLLLNLHAESLNILNQIIAMHPWFFPALADKALVLASGSEWDQALDTAQRLLDGDSENLDALQVIAVHAFTQESHLDEAVQKFDDFESAVRSREPLAVDYAVEISSLFSSICSRQPRALDMCVTLLQRTLKNNLSNTERARLLCKIGHVHLMQGLMFYERAIKCFNEAVGCDNNNVKAVEGMILCHLCEGQYEEAESQIELLLLMHSSSEDLGYNLLYLQSLLTLRDKKNGKKAHLEALNACKEAFLHPTVPEDAEERGLSEPRPYLDSFRSLRANNPDFLMLLATEYLSHSDSSANSTVVAPVSALILNSSDVDQQSAADQQAHRGEEVDSSAEISPAVQSGLDLLNQVLRLCPGAICAYVELARCYSSLGMHDDASRSLQQSLAMQPNCAPILLFMAKVEVARSKIAPADRSLEQALACDFKIRSEPLFKLVKSLIRSQQGRLDEALSETEQLLAMPEFGYSLANASSDTSSSALGSVSGVNYADSLRLTEDDRVSAFVTYASLLGKLRRLKEANKVLGHAKVVFAGSPQEVQVLVAASQLFVEKGDFDSAIRMLDKISEDSPTYARAQVIKAGIILTHNHDKEGYTKCYLQLAAKEPSAKNYSLLGEAFLHILNPEAAIDALDKAYKLDPTNSRLRARIGRTLVSTHEYHRAVEFYESAIRELRKTARDFDPISAENINLSHDLAKLYIKLGRAPNSMRVLNQILRESPSDLTSMQQDVATLLILTKVQALSGNNSPQQQRQQHQDILSTYLRAHSLQREVVLKVRSSVSALSSHDVIEAEKSILSTICDKIGAHHVLLDDAQQAEVFFAEAVQYNQHNVEAMLGLAKLFHARNDRDLCVMQCKKIITAVPMAEEAAVLLSEVQSQSKEAEATEVAILPLTNLLKLQPNNYVALDKAICLLRRAGKLEDAPGFLAAAEKADRRCASHAGYHFCQGLYARYTNDIGKAISEFNLSRKDEVWGANALVHMIELYLNPDQEGIWEEREAGPLDEATRANIAAAEQLLTELRPKSKDSLRVKVLENYCGLATRHKTSVDRAMQSFSEILDGNQDYLPAVLGMATGFMIEKNQHKARNLLKRVGKMEVSRHDGEDFERANLLLAKFYIDKAKNDLAQEQCEKILEQNKSCSQAYEMVGLIFEKDANYERASEAYQKAWKLEFEASASVGFKLAFSYLKCKLYVQAIDVCEAVLNQYPDYPRISEEILKKAQQSIRTSTAA